MSRSFQLACCLLLSLAACRQKDEASPCPSAPPSTDIRLRFLSRADSTDLLNTHALQRDSLLASQPCFTDSLALHFKDYLQPGTGNGITVLEFPNLRNPQLSDQPACFDILLRWNAADTDTVSWRYYQTTDASGCTTYPIGDLYFNRTPVTDVFDGYFRYWTCWK